MNILWLSEIKWSYLRTRKQQILSRFPREDVVLFIEPIAKRSSNRLTFTHDPPVHILTIPHIRAVNNTLVNYLLEKPIVRQCISSMAGHWLASALRILRIKPDILVTSNVYWSRNIRNMKERWPELPVVYECNDNPMGFPRTPCYKRAYVNETLELADLITLPHIACLPVDPVRYEQKTRILSNGVDSARFKGRPLTTPLKELSRPVLMYIGAISEWFDFGLVGRIAEAYCDASLVLIGPIADTVQAQARELFSRPNIRYLPPVPYDDVSTYLSAADVCLIPFVANELTRPVTPNKLFEYAAAGKTTVAGHFNPDLQEYARWVYVAESDSDFMDKLKWALSHPLPVEELQQMAAQHDWAIISRTFREHLLELVAEREPHG